MVTHRVSKFVSQFRRLLSSARVLASSVEKRMESIARCPMLTIIMDSSSKPRDVALEKPMLVLHEDARFSRQRPKTTSKIENTKWVELQV